ncbi:MAG: DUF4395 domain-containing protein [Bacteroidota bacterium]|nr:DUF4395 domain-containing protein [Bacteroidota bacterium]MDP4247522.1 DUF4395 domain-containing protein [Bacteroidota bacterium]MDP4254675.1 DUF4395 domain-containing protein [Bacteroidota bacterium]MDP4260266.1 DUF4395 domain-containing protein [Bacteroidota bacterium]
MSKTIQFGEDVPGYAIRVLNEREIRAAAGVLFLGTFLSLMLIAFKGNFVMIKYVVTIFLLDFLIRVFINPRYAPTLVLGRLIVGRQTPEYVGAAAKRFAWIIGLVLSATMFVFLVIVNAYSPITGFTCLVCLLFLFFESAFGICLGCKFYPLFFKDKVQYCPGEICERQSRQAIQKTSGRQVLVVLAVAVFVGVLAMRYNRYFSREPHNLFRNTAMTNTATVKTK